MRSYGTKAKKPAVPLALLAMKKERFKQVTHTHTMLVDSKMVLYSGSVCGSISTAAIFQTNM